MRNTEDLNERAQYLLKVLVERYIHDGQPVGSRALSRGAGINLSPATIRNVMADLEENGLIFAPHTSSGRIPTVTGYRLFVNSLLTVRPLEGKAVRQMRRDLAPRSDLLDLIESASNLLARLTQMAGIVTRPRRETNAFRHIEFLPLTGSRVLVILVTNEQEVHNRIIQPSAKFSPAELQQAANFLNSMFEGHSLSDLRKKLVDELETIHKQVNQEMINAIEMAKLAFGQTDEEGKEDFVLTGQTNLMEFSDLSNVERLRGLFQAFNQKRGILHLLDQCLDADGVQIFIGEESGYHALQGCSVVSSSYTVDDERVGVLAVIGPTRMKYEKVIPVVDLTAKLLGSALNTRSSPPS
ncbi:MAG: heat-inducible transcriptional repressor HrcA [Methylococcaceae bacterium]|nr:heat-inducible transcriptional repressor HrcA [Methylococcaceae bacterium]